MISFECGTSGDPVDSEYIQDVEDEIGVPFPPRFLNFMKGINGNQWGQSN